LDWHEFLKTKEFEDYHKRMCQEIAGQIHSCIKNDTSCEPEYLKGVMQIAKKMINLPLELTDDFELGDHINGIIQKNFASITTHLLREHLS